MSFCAQVNRWTISFAHEAPNFGKYMLKHDDQEIFVDRYEMRELSALIRTVDAISPSTEEKT